MRVELIENFKFMVKASITRMIRKENKYKFKEGLKMDSLLNQ